MEISEGWNGDMYDGPDVYVKSFGNTVIDRIRYRIELGVYEALYERECKWFKTPSLQGYDNNSLHIQLIQARDGYNIYTRDVARALHEFNRVARYKNVNLYVSALSTVNHPTMSLIKLLRNSDVYSDAGLNVRECIKGYFGGLFRLERRECPSLIHNDVWEGNVIIDPSDDVYIIDYGNAYITSRLYLFDLLYLCFDPETLSFRGDLLAFGMREYVSAGCDTSELDQQVMCFVIYRCLRYIENNGGPYLCVKQVHYLNKVSGTAGGMAKWLH